MTGPPTVRRVGSRWSRDCEGWSCSTNPRSMARHNAHLGEEEIQPRITGGYTDYGTILSPRSAGSCFFFTRNFPCARGVRTLCPLSISRCAARGAHARAGGRPSWRRLGPRRDEPQLSFRLSREMASLVVVSGIAGVEVLVKPCVGHARCLEGGRGVGRGRDGREGTSAGVPEDTRTRSNATHNEHGLSTEALKEWTLAPCLAQGELLGNGVQGE